MPFKSDAQRKAVHAKNNLSTSHQDRFKLLAKTSGKMGKSKEFAMHGGKVVTLKEKAELVRKKELKEKEKK